MIGKTPARGVGDFHLDAGHIQDGGHEVVLPDKQIADLAFLDHARIASDQRYVHRRFVQARRKRIVGMPPQAMLAEEVSLVAGVDH